MTLKLSLAVARRAIPFAFGIHEIFERAKVVWQVVQRYCLPEKVGRRTEHINEPPFGTSSRPLESSSEARQKT